MTPSANSRQPIVRLNQGSVVTGRKMIIPGCWTLKQDGTPKIYKQLTWALDFLDKRQDWVEANPNSARKYCELLEKTDIMKTGKFADIAKVHAIQQNLLKKHPDLFHVISITLGPITIETVTGRLIEKSEVFRTMLTSQFLEAKQNKIILEADEGISNDSIQQFLSYFTTGDCNITHENVLGIFVLAHQNGVTKLETSCETFIIMNNLDSENAMSLFQKACLYEKLDIMWKCASIIQTNGNHLAFLSQDISEKGKDFIKFIVECFDYRITIGFADNGSRMVQIEESSLGIDRIMDLLSSINTKIAIEALKIDLKDITEQNLESMALLFPHLRWLEIHAPKIVTLPAQWLSNLEGVDCSRSSALTSLVVPKAKIVRADGCQSLAELEAQNALEVVSVSCNVLTKLDLGKARKVNTSCCIAMTILNAPRAEELTCFSCSKLENITLQAECKISGKEDLPISVELPNNGKSPIGEYHQGQNRMIKYVAKQKVLVVSCGK